MIKYAIRCYRELRPRHSQTLAYLLFQILLYTFRMEISAETVVFSIGIRIYLFLFHYTLKNSLNVAACRTQKLPTPSNRNVRFFGLIYSHSQTSISQPQFNFSPLLLFQRTRKKISVEFPIQVCRFTQSVRFLFVGCVRKYSISNTRKFNFVFTVAANVRPETSPSRLLGRHFSFAFNILRL